MGAYLSLSGSGRVVGWGGRLFEAGRLLSFSAFRMGAYSNKHGKINNIGRERRQTKEKRSVEVPQLILFETVVSEPATI